MFLNLENLHKVPAFFIEKEQICLADIKCSMFLLKPSPLPPHHCEEELLTIPFLVSLSPPRPNLPTKTSDSWELYQENQIRLEK